MTAAKSPHPTISDVALALATRRHAEPTTKVVVKDDNAKGQVQIVVDVDDPDPKRAAELAANLYKTLRAKYPRENGASA